MWIFFLNTLKILFYPYFSGSKLKLSVFFWSVINSWDLHSQLAEKSRADGLLWLSTGFLRPKQLNCRFRSPIWAIWQVCLFEWLKEFKDHGLISNLKSKVYKWLFSNIGSSCLKRMQNNMALERFAAKTWSFSGFLTLKSVFVPENLIWIDYFYPL